MGTLGTGRGGGPEGQTLESALERLIVEGGDAVGVGLPGPVVSGLARYGALLVSAGSRGGFRAPADARVLVGKHLVDGVTCLLATDFPAGASVVDVGSGVGLPGLVIAICRPEVRVTLAEPRGRRAGFLRWAAWRLGLDNVVVSRQRAEDLRAAGHIFDRVLARALAPFPRAVALCVPLAAGGGRFVAMLGPRGDDEATAAGDAVARAGGVVERMVKVELPWAMGRRVLVVVTRQQEGS